MRSFVQDRDSVNINGKEFSLELFLALKPDYPLRDGWKRVYVPNKRHYITKNRAVLPQKMPWDLGDDYLTRVSDLVYLKDYVDKEKISL